MGRLRELTRVGRYSEALTAAQALATDNVAAQYSRDVLYVIATNQRCLNQVVAALTTLDLLEQHDPHYSRLFQERGYCFVTLRDARRAIAAFQRAVSLDEALPQSWSMLERLYRMIGDTGNAKIAAGHVTRLATLELIDRQCYAQARDELEALLQREPDDEQYLRLYATTLAALGEHEQAIALYRRLLRNSPHSPELHLSLAHALKTTGQTAAAIESYRTAAANRPGLGDAHWSLANLKTYRFSDDELARMRAEEAALPQTQTVDRYHLCFALGKALEDRGEFAQSWHYYEQGNSLKRSQSRYRAEVDATNTRRQIEFFTASFFAARAGVGAPDSDSIFIVGLPRSGSTLVEQILASHSLVEGTQELPDIPRIVRELKGTDEARYPTVLSELSGDDFGKLGRRYLADSTVYRKSSPRRPFFIDKLPNNFHHVGLIHLLLPQATIIDVRREPMACCCSNLKQLFASGQEFSYGMEDVARYYRSYLDLMRHWDGVLPGRILRIQYEDLVADLESNVRRLLQFCRLDFEPACLEFHTTRRNVRTPSSEQVRQPLFRAGLNQWRHYEPWLTPLKDALGDALVRYRD